MKDEDLVVEVLQHEGQESQRRFEFAITTLSLENVLGVCGAGSFTHSSKSWSSQDVLDQFDAVVEVSQSS